MTSAGKCARASGGIMAVIIVVIAGLALNSYVIGRVVDQRLDNLGLSAGSLLVNTQGSQPEGEFGTMEAPMFSIMGLGNVIKMNGETVMTFDAGNTSAQFNIPLMDETGDTVATTGDVEAVAASLDGYVPYTGAASNLAMAALHVLFNSMQIRGDGTIYDGAGGVELVNLVSRTLSGGQWMATNTAITHIFDGGGGSLMIDVDGGHLRSLTWSHTNNATADDHVLNYRTLNNLVQSGVEAMDNALTNEIVFSEAFPAAPSVVFSPTTDFSELANIEFVSSSTTNCKYRVVGSGGIISDTWNVRYQAQYNN